MFRLFFNCVKAFGMRGLLIYLKIKLKSTNNIKLPGIKHPINLRSKGTDLISFREIFFKREYDIALPYTIQPEIIIDAGANIGLTSIFFANQYPNAKIFSIEPDEANSACLFKNTKDYKNITTIKSALWHKKELINIIDKGFGERGFVIEKSESNNILQALSISDLIHDYNLKSIDILKIDIEGSEKEVFSENYESWLPKTKCLIVELHDRIKKGTSKSVFQAIAKYDFSLSIKGENLVFINNQTSH